MDGSIFSSYLLIENGVIAWVNPTKLPVPPTTLEIELGENDLVFPGFLNLHTHIDYNTIPIWKSPVPRWDNRFEWRNNGGYKNDISDVVKAIEKQWDQPAWSGGPNVYTVFAALSELQAIAGGTTVLQETEYLDNQHHIVNKHVLIRSTGVPSDVGLPDSEEIDSVIDFYEPQPRPEGKVYPSTWGWKPTATTSLTQDYLPYLGTPKIQGTLVHLAEGRSGFIQSEGVDGYSRHEYEQFMTDLSAHSADDVRATRMTVIHGCGMNVEDETTRQWMLDYGVNVIWSPVSNLLLYNDTTNVLPLMADRILVGLGSDWSPSGSKHVWDEAKFARFFLNQVGLPGFDTLLFSMISATPAYLLGLGQSGRVQGGYYGDLFILRTDSPVSNPDAPKALAMTSVPNEVEFRGDDIGEWTEVKLDVIKQYAVPYSKILAAQSYLHHEYIDGFAGAGLNRSRLTGDFVPGSPMNALLVEPPFEHYHFIDLDDQKVEALIELARDRPDVDVYAGDCNQILLQEILPKVRYEDYRRALCLLDPYGMHLDWEVVHRAGRMGTIDMLLNFPIGTINRNVLRKDKAQVNAARMMRLDRVWGDRSWQEVAYRVQPGLFGEFTEKTTNADCTNPPGAGFGKIASTEGAGSYLADS